MEAIGPDSGYRQVAAHLRQADVRVGEIRVRKMVQKLYPGDVKRRQNWVANRLARRTYWAAYTDYSWHLDMNEKLGDIGIYFTACIDGFSRLVLWLEPVLDKRAITLWPFFQRVARERGLPDQLVTDKGYENKFLAYVCHFVAGMLPFDCARAAAQIVTSTRNVRVEHFWIEPNIRISRPVLEFVIHLENTFDFTAADCAQLSSLHRVVLPAIMYACMQLRDDRNNRRIQGVAGGIPHRRASATPRPANLHRPFPEDEDFIGEYESSGHALEETVPRVRAIDPLATHPWLAEVREYVFT